MNNLISESLLVRCRKVLVGIKLKDEGNVLDDDLAQVIW